MTRQEYYELYTPAQAAHQEVLNSANAELDAARAAIRADQTLTPEQKDAATQQAIENYNGRIDISWKLFRSIRDPLIERAQREGVV